jgi:hypothetical protein
LAVLDTTKEALQSAPEVDVSKFDTAMNAIGGGAQLAASPSPGETDLTAKPLPQDNLGANAPASDQADGLAANPPAAGDQNSAAGDQDLAQSSPAPGDQNNLVTPAPLTRDPNSLAANPPVGDQNNLDQNNMAANPPAASDQNNLAVSPPADQNNDMVANPPAADGLNNLPPVSPSAPSDLAANPPLDQNNPDQNLTASPPSGGAVTVAEAGTISAADLISAAVYGSDDSNLGNISDVLMTKEGNIDVIIVDVGGFLGIGAKPVAIGFDALDLGTDDTGNLVVHTSFTKEQLDAAPQYDKDTYATQSDSMRLTKSSG